MCTRARGEICWGLFPAADLHTFHGLVSIYSSMMAYVVLAQNNLQCVGSMSAVWLINDLLIVLDNNRALWSPLAGQVINLG